MTVPLNKAQINNSYSITVYVAVRTKGQVQQKDYLCKEKVHHLLNGPTSLTVTSSNYVQRTITEFLFRTQKLLSRYTY